MEKETEKHPKRGRWQWVGPNWGERTRGDIWATCSVCNVRVCIKSDMMGRCPNCNSEMEA